jgi:beta-fructofuranosidase
MKKALCKHQILVLPAMIMAACFTGCLQQEPAGELAGPVQHYREVVKSKDVQTYGDAVLELRRFLMAEDPNYPVYHFTPPESWMNDPNGPIWYQGNYHLFYQFDPQVEDGNGNWVRSRRTWGHAVSSDLVHWKDWPVAIWPDTPYDSAGVYSGNTFIDDNGDLCGLYTGNVAGHGETYGLLIRSEDGGHTFSKKMVMDNAQRPNAASPVHWDGQVWKHNDTWYQLIGGSTGGDSAQGAAWIWRSADLEEWTLVRNIAPSLVRGKFWELPYLIKLEEKYVLFVGSGNPYWIGEFDYTSLEFIPDDPEPRIVDKGFYYSFNVNMVDDKGPGHGPRQLMHGWLTSPPSPTEAVPWWQSCHTIPRVISIKNNRLWQEPVPEISNLRGRHWKLSAAADQQQISEIRGDALEIMVRFDPGDTGPVGLRLRVSDDGEEYVRVYYDPATKTFGVDGPTITRNQEAPGNGRKPAPVSQQIELEDGAGIGMHVFLDRSVLEMYLHGYAITACFFSSPGDVNVELEGDPRQLLSMDVWEMASMWEQQEE